MNDIGVMMFGKFFKLVFWLVVVAVVAIAVTPLDWYYKHVEKSFYPVNLQGVGGTAVKGSADAMYYGLFNLGAAQWLLYPNWFDSVGGKVRVRETGYDITFELDGVKKDTLALKAIRGHVDWDLIKKHLQVRYANLTGHFNLNLQRVRLDKKSGLKGVAGDVTLSNFQMTAPRKQDLGTVRIDFETQKEGMVVGTISSESTVMHVSGTVFLQPNRYKINIDLIPKPGQYEMQSVIQGIGDPRRGGGRRLNLAGFY